MSRLKFAEISRRFVSAKWDVKVWSNAAQAFCCHPVSVYVYSKQTNAGVGVLIWSHICETATVKTYFADLSGASLSFAGIPTSRCKGNEHRTPVVVAFFGACSLLESLSVWKDRLFHEYQGIVLGFSFRFALPTLVPIVDRHISGGKGKE